jgi:hypothetical protein
MSDALFSGWGVRTLSTDDAGFNPIGYHRGTVWPHDNSSSPTAWQYGFRDEANRIALAMLEAAAFSRLRLPEAFSRLPARARPLPVPTHRLQPAGLGDHGAPLLLGRAMLGLEARDGQVTLDPACPTRSAVSRCTGSRRSAPTGTSRRSVGTVTCARPRVEGHARRGN